MSDPLSDFITRALRSRFDLLTKVDASIDSDADTFRYEIREPMLDRDKALIIDMIDAFVGVFRREQSASAKALDDMRARAEAAESALIDLRVRETT